MAAEVDRVEVDNGVESSLLSAPLPPPRQQIGASPPVGSSVVPPDGVGPTDIVVVPSSIGCAVVGQILCAGDVVIDANVGKIEVVLVDDNDVGEDVDGITNGIVDGIVDGIADDGIAAWRGRRGLLLLAILASSALFDCYMLHGRVKKGL